MNSRGQEASLANDPQAGALKILEGLGLEFSMEDGSRRYALYDEIGRGGVARVFYGIDKALHRPVAVKLLRKRLLKDPGSVAFFLNEAKIMAKLDHPGIVPIYDIGIMGNGELFFSMERVEGKTLRELIDDEETDSSTKRNELIRIFEKVCEIVAYAHSRGIVHKDLKPGNIMVGEFGSVYVMDWGIARDLKESRKPHDHHAIELTQLLDAKRVKGTPKYMSPEQILGVSDITQRSDVFSLGMILYEILKGHHPFEGENAREIMHNIKEKPLPPLDSYFISNTLKSICSKSLEKLPQNRYPNAKPLAEDVRRSLSYEQVSVHKDNLLLRSYKFIMRNKLMAAIVLATVLVGGTIFWMKYANYREFDNLVAMADQRTLSADKCRKQIEDLVAMKNTAELSPEDEAYRQREIMRLRMRKNIHLASARALLFLALKKDGHRLPEHMIESLKTTWFLELQSYLRLSDYRGGRQAFREMRDFLNPDNDIMKWTESENKKNQRFHKIFHRQAD